MYAGCCSFWLLTAEACCDPIDGAFVYELAWLAPYIELGLPPPGEDGKYAPPGPVEGGGGAA
jgi:hypothetical protein